MNAQEPRFEDRATWGDVVGAIITGAICLGAVGLSLTFIDMRDRASALTSAPMDAHSALPVVARNPTLSQPWSTE
jgi:CBS-domain-containing membrane protein